jgi:hypothetical protein
LLHVAPVVFFPTICCTLHRLSSSPQFVARYTSCLLAICSGYKTPTAFLNLQKWLLSAQEVWHSTNTAPAMVHGQPEYPYFNLTTLHRDDILYSSSRDYEAMWVVLIELSTEIRYVCLIYGAIRILPIISEQKIQWGKLLSRLKST